MRDLCLFMTLAGVLLTSAAPAEVPQMIHYQGKVVVAATNFEGVGRFKFAFVGTNQAGAAATYWSNDGTSSGGMEPAAAVPLSVSKGIYSLMLGDTALPNMSGLPGGLFTHSDVRLRIWFDGGSGFQQFAPDQRIAAVGYALMAANVADGVVTSAKLAEGAVTASHISSGQVLKSFNGVRDAVQLVGGTNIAVVTRGNTVEVNLSGILAPEQLPADLNAGFLDGLDSTAFWINGGQGTAHFKGNVGIGTGAPHEKLSVDGIVQSISGGFKFPDGTTQTSAATPAAANRLLSGLPAGSSFTILVDGEPASLGHPFRIENQLQTEPDPRTSLPVVVAMAACGTTPLVLRRQRTAAANWSTWGRTNLDSNQNISVNMQLAVPGGGQVLWQLTNGFVSSYGLLIADDGVPIEEIKLCYSPRDIVRTRSGTIPVSRPTLGVNNGFVSGHASAHYVMALDAVEYPEFVITSDTLWDSDVVQLFPVALRSFTYRPAGLRYSKVSVRHNPSASTMLYEWCTNLSTEMPFRTLHLVIKNTTQGDVPVLAISQALPLSYSLSLAADGLPVEDFVLVYNVLSNISP